MNQSECPLGIAMDQRFEQPVLKLGFRKMLPWNLANFHKAQGFRTGNGAIGPPGKINRVLNRNPPVPTARPGCGRSSLIRPPLDGRFAYVKGFGKLFW